MPENRGRVVIRVPEKVRETLMTACAVTGETLNQFVLKAALEKAEKMIADNLDGVRQTALARNVMSLLDGEQQPTPELKEAVKNYKGKQDDPPRGSDGVINVD